MVGKRGLFDEKRRVPAPAQDEEGERSITVWLRSRPAAGAASCVSKDSAGRARVRVPMAGQHIFLEFFSFNMLTVSFEIGNTKKLMPPKRHQSKTWYLMPFL